ncbi:uncharacterized protein LOC106666712 [Cimex lectularius]|uniref:Juvenile hormone binding protein n=1 Tax=Cimex lectularius TaxID=79782 RepID=A0A8I6RQ73_CIMLE|nr:uncharacterized protein LOC106666712 [Cimex lectularius]
MRAVAILVFPLLLCGAFSKPTDNALTLVSNPIDDLITEALEYVRKLFKKFEPFPVPEMPVQTVKGQGIDLTVKFSDLYVSQASDFTIDHIENDIFHLWAKFAVTVPKMHLEGGYNVIGSVKGKNVKGAGHFKLDLTQLKTGGYVEVGLVNKYIQMKRLDIYYDINDLKFSEDGLTVEGLTEEQLANIFDTAFLQYFQDNKQFVTEQVSEYVRGYANEIMHGKTLQQLLDWLKKFIKGVFI